MTTARTFMVALVMWLTPTAALTDDPNGHPADPARVDAPLEDCGCSAYPVGAFYFESPLAKYGWMEDPVP